MRAFTKLSFLLILVLVFFSAQAEQAAKYTPSPENLKARQEFEESRFGIFIHWGIYSTFAQGEWYLQNHNIDKYEYAKAADAFYPHRFNAAEWVSAIKASGAKYICFTSRHHDGFSLYDTCGLSDFDVMHTPAKRDLIKEFVDACNRHGIIPFFYHTTLDWYNEDLMVEPFEMKAALLGERIASRIFPEPMRSEMNKAVSALMMKNENGMDEKAELDCFQVLCPEYLPQVDPDIFLNCYNAWEQRKTLSLKYRSAKKNQSENGKDGESCGTVITTEKIQLNVGDIITQIDDIKINKMNELKKYIYTKTTSSIA